MSIEFGIWRIDEELAPMSLGGVDLENELQEILSTDISLLGEDLMVIGREVTTPYGGRVDILAVDPEGDLVVLELKRDRTPRNIVAQLLDYASWVREMTSDDIQTAFTDYQTQRAGSSAPISVGDALLREFGSKPEGLNANHRLLIVASRLDGATERIVDYLRDAHQVNINAVLFRAFQDGSSRYLARAWLHDSNDVGRVVDLRIAGNAGYNGEYFVNVGDYEDRGWEDACRFGYVSAGGGLRYERAMGRLKVGDRLWAYLSEHGYVGYAEVTEVAVGASAFTVHVDGILKPIAEVVPGARRQIDQGHDEFFVKVKWLRDVERSDAVWEQGMFFGRQTTELPRTSKFLDTIETLKRRWDIE